jgi:uncharacterized RDD family membrane protein YckC
LDGPSEDLILSLASSFFSLWFVIFFTYFMLFGYLGGQTPGKMLYSIQVRSTTLDPLTWEQTIRRAFGYFLSSLFFSAGFLLVLFNRNHRALHDFIAGTCVIRR